MNSRPTILCLLGLLLAVSSSNVQAQTLEEISAERMQQASSAVKAAEQSLQDAEQQLADANAKAAQANQPARALYDEAKDFEDKALEIRKTLWLKTEAKQKELEAKAAGLDQQAASRFERWRSANAAAWEVKNQEEKARDNVTKARAELEKAVADQAKVREQIEEEFKENHPPHLAEVRVFGEEGVVYHGVWVPEKEVLDRRIAILAAAINHIPEIVDNVVADRSAMIDKTAAQSRLADQAMTNYVNVATKIGLKDGGKKVFTAALRVGKSGSKGGLGGAAKRAVVETARAFSEYGEVRDYWQGQRLPATNNPLRDVLDLKSTSDDLQFEREAIKRLEKARGHSSKATSADNSSPDAAPLFDDPQIVDGYARNIVSRIKGDFEKAFSDNELDAATTTTSQRMLDIIERTTGGSPEQREKEFERQVTASGLYSELAKAKLESDRKLWPLHDALREYMTLWVEQARLESETILRTRDELALRRAKLLAEKEHDRLVGLEGADRRHLRAKKKLAETTLDNDTDYGIELVFSSRVSVTSVTIGGVPIRAQAVGDGSKWSGGFNSKDMSGETQVVVDAHDFLLEEQTLDDPRSVPVWSTEAGEFLHYEGDPDKFHKLQVVASSGDTGITVGVADMFGIEGLRVLPTTGVKIRVIDEEGEEVALATTENEFKADFMPLKAGRYTLRLDVGKYEPALPPECTDGYVRGFELKKGDRLQFAASVYSARVANNGNSVGTVTGECIRLNSP